MRKWMLAITLLVAVAVLAGCVQRIDKLNIETPAYMFGNEASRAVDVKMKGTFSRADNKFTGTMQIGDQRLETVVFTPGWGLLHYEEGSGRTHVGQIFYDKKTSSYAIEITDAAMYAQLTGKKRGERSKLVISSPAANEEDAKKLYDELWKPDYSED